MGNDEEKLDLLMDFQQANSRIQIGMFIDFNRNVGFK